MNTYARRMAMAAALIVAFVGTSCGPSTENTARVVVDVPFGLTASTSTTTTTTSLVPPSTFPTEPTESVALFFVLDDRLTPTILDLPLDPSPQLALETLLDGLPRYAQGTVIRTALPEQLTATVVVSRGLAVVDTDTSLLTEISPVDQRLAIGQIVLTLTSRPGIGQVTFTVDGKPQAVPRGGGDLAPANQPVAYDDYVGLLDNDAN
jgi:hypothetical protein